MAIPSVINESLRHACGAGASITQTQIDTWALEWFDTVRPNASNQETLMLVDAQGDSFSPELKAPRWLCHLLGLRHRAVHIVLVWHSPKAGPMLLCQVRSFVKRDFPGHIDISVGGHVKGDDDLYATALTEMREELGLTANDLVDASLQPVGAYDCAIERSDLGFFDREYRIVYMGQVTDVDSIHFQDKEVDGLYLCPLSQAKALLNQSVLPVANGLTWTLPLCLDYLLGANHD